MSYPVIPKQPQWTDQICLLFSFLLLLLWILLGFPLGTVVKNLPASVGDARDTGLIPGLGRCPRVGNGNPLQYSCLENSMDRGAWRATVHGSQESKPPPGAFSLCAWWDLPHEIWMLVCHPSSRPLLHSGSCHYTLWSTQHIAEKVSRKKGLQKATGFSQAKRKQKRNINTCMIDIIMQKCL